jgi:hypothetical protein
MGSSTTTFPRWRSAALLLLVLLACCSLLLGGVEAGRVLTEASSTIGRSRDGFDFFFLVR